MWKKWIIVAVFVLIVILLLPYSLPIVFALLTAVFLDGIVRLFQHKFGFRRIYAVLSTFLLYLASLALLSYFLVNTIFQQLLTLSKKLPAFSTELYMTVIVPTISKWKDYSETLPGNVLYSIERNLENAVNSLDTYVRALVEYIIGFATTIPAFLLEFLIYLVALFLISLELPRLKEKVEAHLNEETKKKLYLVASQLSKAGVGFIKAQIFLSLLTFVMAYIGLWFLNVPYTALLSLLIVVVDILPILGTGSVLVPWAVVAILQGHEHLGIGLIVMFIIITIIRRTVEPKVMSSNMGISPLAALVSLYIGFKILGFIGLFLGPTLVILYDALKNAGVIKFKFKI
ncbi:sporulation integral membrane protein YtvI [Bacillus sp. 165]|uniref:sporulation integral membrane protein YtvI n=1 Tax=Bacillus sp. 165 TaxID=1529117 RepID=UPI001ADB7487|nr:sporulation integral membrane protein YtvI [Bacillus sp. 165]